MHEDAVMAHSTDDMNVRMSCIMLCFCSLDIFMTHLVFSGVKVDSSFTLLLGSENGSLSLA